MPKIFRLRTILLFGVMGAIAYLFGFHLLFLHNALEAIWWGLYYLVGVSVLDYLLDTRWNRDKD